MNKYLNKITCGDCLDHLKNLPDNSIDLIVTDPPYGMDFQSNYRKNKYNKIVNDIDLHWLKDLYVNLRRVLRDNSHAYIFCSFHKVDEFISYSRGILDLKNIIVWEKNNTSMGDLEGDYAPKYEFILFFNNGRKLLNGRRDSNIVKYSRTNNKFHPTQKPDKLIQYLIKKSSKQNDIVLDCFMGSGTTAVACKELGRQYIGFEKEQEYCDIAKQRLKKVNNKKITQWFGGTQ